VDFIVAAKTDIGLCRKNNQDSLSVKVVNTKMGRMVFAVVCDGMGGLSKGEIASATVINAFDKWFMTELPLLCEQEMDEYDIRLRWEEIILEQNELIKRYGTRQGVKLGTTVVALLLTQDKYYVLNVGDSRAYELKDTIRQITKDHSLVAQEVEKGNLTWEEAEKDKRNNVLLQCVGASSSVRPDFFMGDVKEDTVYMLCSDGFRHMISPQEMYEELAPEHLDNADTMQKKAEELIKLNMLRREKDNISVILVKAI